MPMARELHAQGAASPVTRPAKAGDGAAIAACLRPEDAEELRAATGREDLGVLLEQYIREGGYSYVVCDEEGPFLLGGATLPLYETSHGLATCLWLVAATRYRRHARWIIRNTKPWIRAVLNHNGCVGHNFVDSRNTVHIRWLQWAGATFTGKVITQADPSVPFLEFFYV